MFKPPATLSIIIPYLERPEYPDLWMIECLCSIRAQDCPFWDVTWIGDAPRPVFESIIPMTVIKTLERTDTARCVNHAASQSKGDLIFALSSNDWISKDFCGAAISALTANPLAEWWGPNGNSPEEEYMRNAIMEPACVLRRESYHRLGGYMEWPGINGKTFPGLEDWHLWMRIYRGKVPGAGSNLPHWIYRNHPGGSCGSQDIISSWAFEPKLKWMRETADAFGIQEEERRQRVSSED